MSRREPPAGAALSEAKGSHAGVAKTGEVPLSPLAEPLIVAPQNGLPAKASGTQRRSTTRKRTTSR
jgi:hypothetical protein